MWGITCGDCGQLADYEAWQQSEDGQLLPKNHFQCPGCRVKIRKESEPPEVVDIEGHQLVIPGDASIVYC